jgi:hypothetical protein
VMASDWQDEFIVTIQGRPLSSIPDIAVLPKLKQLVVVPFAATSVVFADNHSVKLFFASSVNQERLSAVIAEHYPDISASWGDAADGAKVLRLSI